MPNSYVAFMIVDGEGGWHDGQQNGVGRSRRDRDRTHCGGMVWSGEKDRHRGDAAQEVIAMAMNSKVTIQQGIMKVDVDAESGSVIMT